jgi:hypothetical protein
MDSRRPYDLDFEVIREERQLLEQIRRQDSPFPVAWFLPDSVDVEGGEVGATPRTSPGTRPALRVAVSLRSAPTRASSAASIELGLPFDEEVRALNPDRKAEGSREASASAITNSHLSFNPLRSGPTEPSADSVTPGLRPRRQEARIRGLDGPARLEIDRSGGWVGDGRWRQMNWVTGAVFDL